MTTTSAPAPKAGRRKEAVARVRLLAGSGAHKINGRDATEYFPRELWLREAFGALVATNNEAKYDVHARVSGGGLSGQAGAVLHAHPTFATALPARSRQQNRYCCGSLSKLRKPAIGK